MTSRKRWEHEKVLTTFIQFLIRKISDNIKAILSGAFSGEHATIKIRQHIKILHSFIQDQKSDQPNLHVLLVLSVEMFGEMGCAAGGETPHLSSLNNLLVFVGR